MQWIDDKLANSDVLSGDKLSAADITTMPVIEVLRRAGGRHDAVRLGLGLDDFHGRYRNISAWLGRI